MICVEKKLFGQTTEGTFWLYWLHFYFYKRKGFEYENERVVQIKKKLSWETGLAGVTGVSTSWNQIKGSAKHLKLLSPIQRLKSLPYLVRVKLCSDQGFIKWSFCPPTCSISSNYFSSDQQCRTPGALWGLLAPTTYQFTEGTHPPIAAKNQPPFNYLLSALPPFVHLLPAKSLVQLYCNYANWQTLRPWLSL